MQICIPEVKKKLNQQAIRYSRRRREVGVAAALSVFRENVGIARLGCGSGYALCGVGDENEVPWGEPEGL